MKRLFVLLAIFFMAVPAFAQGHDNAWLTRELSNKNIFGQIGPTPVPYPIYINCTYNSTPPTPTAGQSVGCQANSAGAIITTGGAVYNGINGQALQNASFFGAGCVYAPSGTITVGTFNPLLCNSAGQLVTTANVTFPYGVGIGQTSQTTSFLGAACFRPLTYPPAPAVSSVSPCLINQAGSIEVTTDAYSQVGVIPVAGASPIPVTITNTNVPIYITPNATPTPVQLDVNGNVPTNQTVYGSGGIGSAATAYLSALPDNGVFNPSAITTATTTLVVSGIASERLYIYYAGGITSATNSGSYIGFEYGTGSTCGTGTTTLFYPGQASLGTGAGDWTTLWGGNNAAGTGSANLVPSGVPYVIPAGDNLCAVTAGTTIAVKPIVAYAQH